MTTDHRTSYVVCLCLGQSDFLQHLNMQNSNSRHLNCTFNASFCFGDKWLQNKTRHPKKKKKQKHDLRAAQKACTEKPLKGAMLHCFIERAQQLVCSAAFGQMIEAVDKIECQRADGHGETERGRAKKLSKVKRTKKTQTEQPGQCQAK